MSPVTIAAPRGFFVVVFAQGSITVKDERAAGDRAHKVPPLAALLQPVADTPPPAAATPPTGWQGVAAASGPGAVIRRGARKQPGRMAVATAGEHRACNNK